MTRCPLVGRNWDDLATYVDFGVSVLTPQVNKLTILNPLPMIRMIRVERSPHGLSEYNALATFSRPSHLYSGILQLLA